MNQMHAVYPDYAFASHKGYATALHRRLLAQHGPCPLHRRSFAPVGTLWDTEDGWQRDFAGLDADERDFDLELDSDADFGPIPER
jgi:hypothetical protein